MKKKAHLDAVLLVLLALSISFLHRGGFSDDTIGIVHNCAMYRATGEWNFTPNSETMSPGWQGLVLLSLDLFGWNLLALNFFPLVFWLAAVFLFRLYAGELFTGRFFANLAGVLFTAHPLAINFMNSPAVEPVGMFFMILSLWLSRQVWRRATLWRQAALIFSLIVMLSFMLEAAVLAVAFLCEAFIRKSHRLVLSTGVAGVLILFVGWLLVARTGWLMPADPRLQMIYSFPLKVIEGVPELARIPTVAINLFLGPFLLLAVAGALFFGIRKRLLDCILVTLALVYLEICIMSVGNPYGPMAYPFHVHRHMSALIGPVAILVAAGSYWLFLFLRKRTARKKARKIVVAVSLVTVLCTVAIGAILFVRTAAVSGHITLYGLLARDTSLPGIAHGFPTGKIDCPDEELDLLMRTRVTIRKKVNGVYHPVDLRFTEGWIFDTTSHDRYAPPRQIQWVIERSQNENLDISDYYLQVRRPFREGEMIHTLRYNAPIARLYVCAEGFLLPGDRIDVSVSPDRENWQRVSGVRQYFFRAYWGQYVDPDPFGTDAPVVYVRVRISSGPDPFDISRFVRRAGLNCLGVGVVFRNSELLTSQDR